MLKLPKRNIFIRFYIFVNERVRKLFLLLLLLLSLQPVYTQTVNFEFDRLNIENGLSNNYVTDIIQDNLGFMWFGTIDGLNRYDGYSVKIFRNRLNDTTSLYQNNIRCLEIDKFGNIYVLTDECIHKYDTRSGIFTRFIVNKLNKNINNVSGIFSCIMDKNDYLWLGANNSLLWFDTKTARLHKFPLNDSLKINNISIQFIDKQNNLWFNTSSKGIFQLNLYTNELTYHNKKKIQGQDILLDDRRTMFQDNANNILIPYKKNVINLTTNEINYIIDNKDTLSVRAIFQDQSGQYWYETWTGLAFQDAVSKEIIMFNNYTSFPDEISTLTNFHQHFLDYTGCLWLGSYNSGVHKINTEGNKFMHYHTFNSNSKIIKNIYVQEIAIDTDRKLWLTSSNSGIIHYDPDKPENYRFLMPEINAGSNLSGSRFISILRDKNSRIWIGGNAGVNVYNKKTGNFTWYRPDTKPALNAWTILTMFEDSKSNVWIGFSGGIAKYNPFQNKILHYYYNKKDISGSFPGNFITCIREDKDGYLWFASSDAHKGLIRSEDKPDHFIAIPLRYNGKNMTAKTLFIDQDTIWVGTEEQGLIKFNRKNHKIIKIYTENDGLPNNNICGILKDSSGNLWLSTFHGLSKFNVKKGTFLNYDINDGLQSNQFNYNSCCKLPDGRMVFGGINGFNIFHPDSIKNNPYTPKVVLTDFKIFNKPVNPGDVINGEIILGQSVENIKNLVLSYREKIFSFEFSALHYASPNKIQYAYMLEGFDKGWNYTDYKRRYVSYSNLSSGKYVFRIKATNNDGIWCKTEDEVALQITITPPFWQTWWFRILIGIIILSSFYSWYLLRTRRLRLHKIMLERKVKERTAEINQQKEELHHQKEELATQADNLQEANILLKEHGEELEAFSEELKAQGEELYSANEQLVQLNATKDRFFSIIAHDLRNPFQAIIGISELIGKKFNELTRSKKIEMLDDINISSKNAHSLLENLLAWARSQTGHIKFNPALIDITSIAKKTKQLLDLQASGKKITIEVDIQKKIKAFADPAMVETILRNITSNAIKFTTIGGKITISAYDKLSYAVVSISDTGIGMSPEVIKKLFRIETTHVGQGTAGEHGTGLGLILCDEFAKKNDGYIKVKSEPGNGSAFRIFLPKTRTSGHILKKQKNIENYKRKEQETKPLFTEPLINSEGHKYHVLIVDDNPNILKNITTYLEPIFKISEAKNGKDALHKLLADIPDIIVSDVMMPEMDGFEFCNILKKDERINHIPIILLTAKISDNSRIKGLGAGADDYITKPFNIQVLEAKIRALIIKRQKLRERFRNEVYLNPNDIKITSPNEKFLKKAREIVEKYMDDSSFSPDIFVKEIGMSRNIAYSKLRSLTGYGIYEYIQILRLKRSAQLLTEGKSTVADAAYATGFKNPNHFSTAFSNFFGCPPSTYTGKSKRPL